MTRTPAAWLLSMAAALCSASPACGQSIPEEAARERWLLEVPIAPGEEPVAYRWGHRGRVDAARLVAPGRFAYGQAGVTASTVLLLPFDSEDPGTAHPSSLRLDEDGCGRSAGLFGRALELTGRSSRARASWEGGESFDGAWTIDFWFRPADVGPRGAGRLLTVPGVCQASVSREGRLQLTLHSEPSVSFSSRGALVAGRWHHVAVALDDEVLGGVSLVLDDEPVGRRSGSRPPAAGVRELVLGAADGVSGVPGSVDELHVDATRLSSEAVLERGRLVPDPGAHELELELADGSRRVVTAWYGASTEPVLRGEDAWRRGVHRHTVPLDGALGWAAGHWEEIDTAVSPIARTCHANAYLGDNRIFMFGGETRDTHVAPMQNTDDTWIFRTDEGSWRRIDAQPRPAPRCHQPMAYSPDHDLVLCFGGMDNSDASKPTIVRGDTWVYHVAEERWEERSPSGFTMRPMCNKAMLYLPGARLFLLAQGRSMELYDPEADAWSKVPFPRVVTEDGEPAEYESGHSVTTGLDPDRGELLLFGGGMGRKGPDGKRSYSFHDTTAIYSLARNTITLVETDVAPSPRVRPGFAYDPLRRHFVLFGGVQDQFSRRKNDLWTFDPETRRWREHDASNMPIARGGFYGMPYDPELDRFFLLCGRHATARFLDEVWSLHLDESAPGQALFVFDRATYGEHAWWFAEHEVPEGSSVGFRFRGSDDALSWGAWGDSPAHLAPELSRFVQVEVELVPSAEGTAPRVTALGFAADGEQESSGGRTVQRVPPLR